MSASRRGEPRRVSVLGSTGSVGCSTVDLLLAGAGAYEVEALTAHGNAWLLAEQARALAAKVAVVADPTAYPALKEALSGSGIEAMAGRDAVIEAAARPADWVMAAIVGAAGLEPALAAIGQGGVIALANKECLVCAGDLVMAEVRRHGATLLPVDSEHNAIFQVFDFAHSDRIERVILTASGGPFLRFDPEEMALVTPEQAVAHPNWDMGAKVSVDSATMMNKGLELIETHHLFPVRDEMIEVLVHPQSVIHAMVCYVDGSILAQIAAPDMRTPIAHALGWPDRIRAASRRLDFTQLREFSFEPPDLVRFPALKLARQALKSGGACPTILNAANEVAVRRFLAGEIGFLDIARIVERSLEHLPNSRPTSLEEILGVDRLARDTAAHVAAELATAG
ncbi:MAG: 1-deoxy-D-xylulose-5-phosphate reductoisomerase [Proteobacteria bacterium]|nr:1-deoxy-D-xylulose-5-phosphate reductoisomerase [Pseudomonadota bacterium]